VSASGVNVLLESLVGSNGTHSSSSSMGQPWAYRTVQAEQEHPSAAPEVMPPSCPPNSELGVLPSCLRVPGCPAPHGTSVPGPECIAQGNTGRGHPRGCAEPATWFVNDYLMTLGGPQGGVGPPGRLAPPVTSAGPCSLPWSSSWTLAHWGQYKRGVEEWEGSRRPRGHKGN